MEMKKSASEDSTLIKRDEDPSDEPDERGCSTCCRFPPSVFFIIVNEFCERFYYYGMRAVLMLYLVNHVGLMKNDATALFHGWVALTYVTPLVGGILADSYFGKYKIILWLSIVYMIGAVIMSMTAIPAPNLPGPVIALLLIAVGGGCIKACTSAFGGDQITGDKIKLQESFFSVFYFTINAGSVLSSIITPLFRAHVSCLGQSTCFPLAFGFPAILMLIAIIVFVAGRKRYIIKPVTSSVVLRSIQCCCYGFQQYMKEEKDVKKNSWIDYANDQYDQSFINDIKAVGRILVLFAPILVFWALFDQQSSLWVLQGSQMDGQITKNLFILCDQMNAINPILILLFIPLFESFIYPLVEYIGIPNKPLRRMTIGMFLAATAFLVSFFVQLKIETTLPKDIPAGRAQLSLVSLSNGCNLKASSGGVKLVTSKAFAASGTAMFAAGSALTFQLILKCKTGETKKQVPLKLLSKEDFALFGWLEGSKLRYKLVKNSLKKDEKGFGRVRAVYRENAGIVNGLSLTAPGHSYRFIANASSGLVVTPYQSIQPSYYSVTVRKHGQNSSYSLGHLNLKSGATFILLPHSTAHGAWRMDTVEEVKANSVHLLIQIPQYILITTAEIMVSITGLSYSYAQAPVSMKSTVSALWLVTVGIGNLLVVVVAESVRSAKLSLMMIIFSILAYITGVLFAIDAYFYVPNNPIKPREEDDYEPVKDD